MLQRAIIDDYTVHYGRVDKIYTEFDSQGNNKSSSVLQPLDKNMQEQEAT